MWRSIARSMRRFARTMRRRSSRWCSMEEARGRRTPIVWREEDLAKPEFTGVRVLEDFSLETLREFIDWTPFFHTWGMKGIYPRIMEGEGQGAEAKKIFADAQVLLDRIIAEKLITARGVYGLFPRECVRRRCGAVHGRDARRAGGAVPLSASAGQPRRQRAVPVAERLYRADGDGAARLYGRVRGDGG